MTKETLDLLKLYESQIPSNEAAFKHYSQGPADPIPYIEGGSVSPYYDYSEYVYSEYVDW